MVVKIHGGPQYPAHIRDEDGAETREAVLHEQSFEHRIGGVQTREGAERHRRGGEAGGVHIDTQQLIYASQSGGGSLHPVVCGLEAVGSLVPRGRARQDELDGDAEHAHVTKSAGEHGGGPRRGEEEEEAAADGGQGKVAYAVREPGQDVQDGVRMSREDIREIGAVEHILEGGQHLDPDVRAVLGRDEAVAIHHVRNGLIQNAAKSNSATAVIPPSSLGRAFDRPGSPEGDDNGQKKGEGKQNHEKRGNPEERTVAVAGKRGEAYRLEKKYKR